MVALVGVMVRMVVMMCGHGSRISRGWSAALVVVIMGRGDISC